MFFASDNSGPVHPRVMERVAQANQGFAGAYGADPVMEGVRQQIRDLFEAPDAAVYLVATGTAANSLVLATLGQPWQTIFCSPVAHIHEDECNAPEFFTGGAKLTLVGTGDKITPEALRNSIAAQQARGVHGPQRGPVSLTQVTELGQVYSVAELAALSAVAREFDLPVHMDGARFANALVTLDCTPAEMTWKAGIDAVSFGATKNGCMGVEAVIFFDPAHAWEFELRRKRGAHLFSKYRYLAAQMAGYLEDDLWLNSARAANARAERLADGLRRAGAQFLLDPQANMVFAALPRVTHEKLFAAGAAYHLWGAVLDGEDPQEMLGARFVCDWSITEGEIDRFLDLI
ncbi:MAG: low specificity L-threonine aldolase [Rhodobacteraceae bacterium]|nr:low specificity L-threonine aldolase [Paracoccaceae bacterium]